jgi:hypothetical protein
MALVALANQPVEIPATTGSLWTGLRHWLWQDPVAFTRNLQPLLARRGVLVKPEQDCVLWLFANDYFRKYDNNTGSVTATISCESLQRSSDEQDWQGPLLLCSEMQAGDVLLLRGTGVKSALIASAAGGVYSHAALILKDSEDFLAQIYESDGLGVGPSSYPTATVRIQGTTRLPLALVMGREVQVARLLRHPEIEKVPSSTLSAAQTLIRSEHNFRSYSAIGRLVRPLGLPSFVELSINRVQELNDRLANRELRRGVFCSELVGVFFDHLGLPLLPGGHDSSTLSPNHLDQGRSNLVDVPQAVINRERFDQVVGLEVHDHQFTPRERALPGMVEMSATAERTGAKSRQILDLIKDLSGGVHARSQQQAREHLGAINTAVDGYLSIGDVNRAQRMARSASSIRWSVMAEQIAHEALFRDWVALGVQSKDFEPVVVAAIKHLHSLVQTVRIITRHDETRLNLRWLLGNLKKEDDISAVARWKNRRQRRKLLHDWLELRGSQKEAISTIAREFYQEALPEEASRLVSSLLDEVEQRIEETADTSNATEGSLPGSGTSAGDQSN